MDLITEFFVNHQSLKGFVKVNVSLADQALVSGSIFIIGILIARFLGVEELGRFTFLWIMIQFFYNLQYAVIVAPMMSIAPKQASHELSQYLGANLIFESIFISLFILLFGFGLPGTIAAFLHWENQSIALPVIYAGTLFLAIDFLRRLFYTLNDTTLAFLVDLIGFGGQFAGVVSLFIFTDHVALRDIFIVSGIAFSMAMIFGVRHAMGRFSFPKSLLIVLDRHKAFISGIVMFTIIQWGGPQLILLLTGILLGPASLGGIRAVVNLLAPINVAMLGMQNILTVKASYTYHAGSRKDLQALLRKVFNLILSTLIVVSILAVGFKNQLLMLVYANLEYLEYSTLVLWQVLYLFFDVIIILTVIYLKTLEDTKVLSIAAFLAFAISFVSAWILLPYLNETATFIGLIIHQIVILACLVFKLGKNSYTHKPASAAI